MIAAQKGDKHHMFGKQHSSETRAKMSAALKGEKDPMFGLKHSEETISKLIAATKDKCQKIEVTDLTTNQITIYDSIRAAGRALDISQSRISVYFKQNQKSPYKGRYIFKKV